MDLNFVVGELMLSVTMPRERRVLKGYYAVQDKKPLCESMARFGVNIPFPTHKHGVAGLVNSSSRTGHIKEHWHHRKSQRPFRFKYQVGNARFIKVAFFMSSARKGQTQNSVTSYTSYIGALFSSTWNK